MTENTADQSYLRWLAEETPTSWWHDSAEPEELQRGLSHGATGVTTNPVLTHAALKSNGMLRSEAAESARRAATREERAEILMSCVLRNAARMLEPAHERTRQRQGYVCAQVNPAKAADREAMLSMARRFHAWAPNISVKLPVTVAGLDVMEECAAEGITFTATVSFTVPQAIAVAEAYHRGLARARQAGKTPGQCFVTIMIGRLDDYLRDVIWDSKGAISESDIQQAGLAITKRAYQMYKERRYQATLIIAALRGTYHMTELAGGELIMSIHPKYQSLLLEPGVPRAIRIDQPVPPDVIARLQTLPEFIRAYEPEAMPPEEFITFGATQRTLSQFSAAGWLLLESMTIP